MLQAALLSHLPVCLALGFVLQSCVPALPSRGRTMSVRELSRDFVAYADQLISVRGIYHFGLRQDCPQKCANGEPWPSILDLTSSEVSHERVSFSTDQPSWDAVDAVVRQVAKSGEDAQVWVTVEGRLKVWSNSPIGPCDRMNQIYGGVQARGWHGALLVVKRISNVEVLKSPLR
jgi:hypothetical protein